MPLSTYGDNKALSSIFGSGTPGTLYVGLSTTTISQDGSGITEPSACTQLTSALASGTAYTSLAVQALTGPVASGDSIVIGSGGTTQTVTASAAAAVGATSITVTSFTANAAYAVGTQVIDSQLGYSRASVVNTSAAANWTISNIALGSGGGAKMQNANPISFPTSTAAWGTVTAYFISDAPGGGNIYAYGALSANQNVGNNNTLSFAANQLTINAV